MAISTGSGFLNWTAVPIDSSIMREVTRVGKVEAKAAPMWAPVEWPR